MHHPQQAWPTPPMRTTTQTGESTGNTRTPPRRSMPQATDASWATPACALAYILWRQSHKSSTRAGTGRPLQLVWQIMLIWYTALLTPGPLHLGPSALQPPGTHDPRHHSALHRLRSLRSKPSGTRRCQRTCARGQQGHERGHRPRPPSETRRQRRRRILQNWIHHSLTGEDNPHLYDHGTGSRNRIVRVASRLSVCLSHPGREGGRGSGGVATRQRRGKR